MPIATKSKAKIRNERKIRNSGDEKEIVKFDVGKKAES